MIRLKEKKHKNVKNRKKAVKQQQIHVGVGNKANKRGNNYMVVIKGCIFSVFVAYSAFLPSYTQPV